MGLGNCYRDTNAAVPTGVCPVCGGEIYDRGELCVECRTSEAVKAHRWDQKTARDVMEEMDFYLQKILAEGPRNELWNALAEKFLTDAEDEMEGEAV